MIETSFFGAQMDGSEWCRLLARALSREIYETETSEFLAGTWTVWGEANFR